MKWLQTGGLCWCRNLMVFAVFPEDAYLARLFSEF